MDKPWDNLTTTFLLPLLGNVRSVYEPYLVNAYLYDEGIDSLQSGCLFIVLKYKGDLRFEALEELLRESEEFMTDYKLGSKGEFWVYVMSIPREFSEDYKSFKEGEYSQFSNTAKRIVLFDKKSDGRISKVFDKHSDLRERLEKETGEELPEDAELMTVWNDSDRKKKEIITKNTLAELGEIYNIKVDLNKFEEDF